MADSTVSQQRSAGQRLKHGVESKILVPAAAGIVTLAVKYLLKKLPLILEEKVLPKLVENDAPARVTQAVEGTATKLGGSGDGDSAAPGEDKPKRQEPKSKPAEQAPDSDREAERRKREQRREQRKRDLNRAA